MTSVALVVLDTVRWDAFQREFDWLDGTWFSRAYSTSHWTVPAHASLFTGEYASEAGVHARSPTMDYPGETLAEAFAAAGYRTRCLTANPQLVQYDGWARGFDEFDGPANLGRVDDGVFDWEAHIDATDPGLGRYLRGLRAVLRSDCDVLRSLKYGYDLHRTPAWAGGVDAVADRVAAIDFGADEFLFANLMDAHTPYYPPPGEADSRTVVVADAFADDVDAPRAVRAAYRESVRALADRYREVYGQLREGFDYVVTVADHGELLGEHGLWNHSVSVHPELVHVPLVVSGDDVDDAVVHDVVDLLDVHRTVAELADVDVDSRGRHLLGERDPKTHLVESHGLLPFHDRQFERAGVPQWRFERWRDPLAGIVEENGTYAYQSAPGEFRVLGDVDPGVARRRLDAAVAALDRRDVAEDDGSHSDVAMDRLEALGYA